jgi:hypothetical protein
MKTKNEGNLSKTSDAKKDKKKQTQEQTLTKYHNSKG